jgi:hypothetical protein
MHSRVVFRYVTFSTRNYRVLTVLVRGGGELLQGGMLNTSHKVASFMRGIQIYMAFFMMLAGLMQASAQSLITPQAPAPLVVDPAALHLSAVFVGDNKPIRLGLDWRIFEDKNDASTPVPIAKSDQPSPTFALPPGSYIIHVVYGFASSSKKLVVGTAHMTERLSLNAGALKLRGAVGDSIIQPAKLSFSVYVPLGNDSEGRLVMANARGDEVIRLPEGTYHVVSTYGDTNAIMRADLKVEPGKVTEATLNHRAATVTLKLVAKNGGEAFAGTAFSVLTPGGDVIREAIGAFPSMTLAEGEYVLIARHDGKIYTHNFKVESGVDRDIEALAQ